MIVTAYRPEHFESLVLQPHQAAWQPMLEATDWRCLSQAGEAWTGLVGDRVVGCAGIYDLGGGRGEAWALIAQDAGAHMLPITRAVGRALRLTGLRRVQAVTACNFPPARRWVTMLGFRFEGVLRAYCDDGADAEIWSRVK